MMMIWRSIYSVGVLNETDESLEDMDLTVNARIYSIPA